MARPSERRAALVQREGLLEPRSVAIAPGIYHFDGDNAGDSMKIQFVSVHLDNTIPRLPGGNKGLAASETSFFDVTRTPGVTIELDTASQLVRLSNEQGECFVPISKVTRFGAVMENTTSSKGDSK